MIILARRFCTILPARPFSPLAVVLGLLSLFVFAPTGSAQTTQPLSFGNNVFVTGDYVVAGVGLRGLGDGSGYATGQIHMPDTNSVPAGGVPQGADIVAAILYWETVESSQTSFAGQQGFFRPVFSGGPATGYAITGNILGNPNAPVSWSSGGCSGNSQGSKTMRTYSADVRRFLPVDSNGIVQANGTYEVRLADSGSNGGGAPLTLGATLVIIYRVLDSHTPLNSVVIYAGAYAPANGSSTMTQAMQGFYQAAASPIAKLTQIVGNGQSNKYEYVYLNSVNLTSLYGALPPFPGNYNGSWDNPTWIVNSYGAAVNANDSSLTTSVVPNSSNSGCVSWGATIFSTTVQNSDHDGILDVWKANHGYCDASINGGVCNIGDTSDPGWVPLPGATQGEKDLFVEMDYMCSIVNSDGTCDTTHGYSFLPGSDATTKMVNAFSPHNINLHLIPSHAIQEQTCTDGTDSSGNPLLCAYPNQPGVVGWKGSYVFLKNQPLNYPDESSCEAAASGPCIRRFQHGKKDSYHYVLFGHSLAVPNWSFLAGNLQSVVASGSTMTFTTSADNGLVEDPNAGNGRVNISNIITNPNLNGIYLVHNVTPTSFTINIGVTTNATLTKFTDPYLSVASGQAGTVSGASDLGGQDSAITLGSWGADGQTVNVQAGTFMHELGHSLGLTHGGFYYNTPASFVATLGENCKANFQSVMNYLFQVDLLNDTVLDYSEQNLNSIDEANPPSAVTSTSGPTTYSKTQWYALSPPGGIGTAATRHCDGTPLLSTDVPMYRVEGDTNPISPGWVSNQDINYDGKITSSLRGYDDWDNLDPRQIGASGSLTTAGGVGSANWGVGSANWGVGSANWGVGSANWGVGSANWGVGSANWGVGSANWGVGSANWGVGHGEFTHEAANSATRPPRNVTATTTPPPRYIRVSWLQPSFGQIGYYNVYRSTNGAPAVQISTPGAVTSLSFTDTNVTCGPTYVYYVSAVLAGTNPPQESVQATALPNPVNDCAPPYTFTGFYSPLTTADPPNTGSFSGRFNVGKSVTAKWTLQDSNGNIVTNLNVNTLYVTGVYVPFTSGPACSTTQAPLISSYNGALPPNVTVLFSPTSGAKGNSTFRFSTNQFVFNWDTTGLQTGCWVLELDLDSGQVRRTSLQLR